MLIKDRSSEIERDLVEEDLTTREGDVEENVSVS